MRESHATQNRFCQLSWPKSFEDGQKIANRFLEKSVEHQSHFVQLVAVAQSTSAARPDEASPSASAKLSSHEAWLPTWRGQGGNKKMWRSEDSALGTLTCGGPRTYNVTVAIVAVVVVACHAAGIPPRHPCNSRFPSVICTPIRGKGTSLLPPYASNPRKCTEMCQKSGGHKSVHQACTACTACTAAFFCLQSLGRALPIPATLHLLGCDKTLVNWRTSPASGARDAHSCDFSGSLPSVQRVQRCRDWLRGFTAGHCKSGG